MTRQEANLIVWNEEGLECQRLYFDYRKTSPGKSVTNEYSDYHTGKYSFQQDSMFFSAQVIFYVIPKVKRQSYVGYLAQIQGGIAYDQVSAHYMKNSPEIWLLGGFKYKGISSCALCDNVPLDIDYSYESRIVNLE